MNRAVFHDSLFQWYRRQGRHDLPWRQTRDPYAIWLSEVMLQQTQVKTVLERFYFPFLERFPTVRDLAQAPLQDVLKQWQGLGYYRRARNFHLAAQQVAEHGFPSTVKGWLALPGVGQNTAHAVCAFAYRLPVPVLEANVKRVVARIFALSEPKPAELWDKAAELLGDADPFDYNQAMMDLGAMICTPRTPACMLCPANSICQGQVEPEAYPAQKVKAKVPVRQRQVVLFTRNDGRMFIEPRRGEFLHGLWAFPEWDRQEQTPIFFNRRYPLETMQQLGVVNHAYSHFQLDAVILQQQVTEVEDGPYWKSADEIATLPLSRLELKILKLLR